MRADVLYALDAIRWPDGSVIKLSFSEDRKAPFVVQVKLPNDGAECRIKMPSWEQAKAYFERLLSMGYGPDLGDPYAIGYHAVGTLHGNTFPPI